MFAYTPFPLKMLGQLAGLCKPVKDKLAADITRMKGQTPIGISQPGCSAETAVGRMIAALSGRTDPALIETLSTLSQEEKVRLAQLTADLGDDPQRVVRQLGALKTKDRRTDPSARRRVRQCGRSALRTARATGS